MVSVSKLGAGILPSPNARFSWPASFERFSVYRFFYLSLAFGMFTIAHGADKSYYANREARSCVCDGDFDAGKDYFPHKVTVDYSTDLWNVSYHNSYKKVTLNTDEGEQTWFLYLCGTPVPDAAGAGDQVVEVPIKSTAFTSSTTIHLFDYIGQRSSIAAYYSGWASPVWTNACLQAGQEAGLFSLITDAASVTADVTFSDSFTKDVGTSPSFQILNGASANPTIFGQAEWVEAVSLFFNREEAAVDVVEKIKQRYDCHKDTVSALAPPSVLAFYFDFYGFDSAGKTCAANFTSMEVYVSGCAVSDFRNPLCEQMTDAGAVPLPVDDAAWNANRTLSAGTYKVTLAELQALPGFAAVEVIYYLNDLASALAKDNCTDAMDAAMSGVAAWTNGNVYDVYKTTAVYPFYTPTYWFEGRGAEPDVTLLDFIETVHPTAVNHTRVFLRKALAPNVEPSVVVTSADCVDIFSPLYSGWKATPCDGNSGNAVIVGLEPVQSNEICATPAPTSSATELSVMATIIVAMLAMLVV